MRRHRTARRVNAGYLCRSGGLWCRPHPGALAMRMRSGSGPGADAARLYDSAPSGAQEARPPPSTKSAWAHLLVKPSSRTRPTCPSAHGSIVVIKDFDQNVFGLNVIILGFWALRAGNFPNLLRAIDVDHAHVPSCDNREPSRKRVRAFKKPNCVICRERVSPGTSHCDRSR